MNTPPLRFSIVINNYNYGCFLGEAIQSALSQTLPALEVIVVDDGSTDESRKVIESFGASIQSVYQENMGQASAINRGCSLAQGDLFCLLDADDLFYPTKLKEIDALLSSGNYRMNDPFLFSHTLEAISKDRHPKGFTMPPKFKNIRHRIIPAFPTDGLLSTPAEAIAFIKRHAMPPFLGSTTSGLFFNRALYSRLFPLPVLNHVKVTGDSFIVPGGMLLGNNYAFQKILGAYRIHGKNVWYDTDSVAPETVRRRIKKNLSYFEPWLNSILESLNTKTRADYRASTNALWFYIYSQNITGLLNIIPRLLRRGLYRRNVLISGYALWKALCIKISQFKNPPKKR